MFKLPFLLLVLVLVLVLLLLLAFPGIAQEPATFDANTGTLTIPEVIVGNKSIFNARLLFDGTNNFQLLGFDKQPASTTNTIPPTESAAVIQQWLDSGVYKSWSCENAAHGPILNSPHGNVRICSNAILTNATTTPYPVGSASVKELYSGNTITGYAVGVKVTASPASNSWFWYEKIGSSLIANSPGAGICEGCHSGASNDRVFVKVTP